MASKKIYLASASPRRKELLELTGLSFSVKPLENFDEEAVLKHCDCDVTESAEFLAREKAKAALERDPDAIIITADTIVISDDGKVLGKPSNISEAAMFLDKLAGNWHTVATGVAIADRNISNAPPTAKPDFPNATDRILSALETTRVKFADMTDREIQDYIDTGEPFDKAGGYGIQGRASVHIERIEGDYFNVVGFPLHAFWKIWKEFIS